MRKAVKSQQQTDRKLYPINEHTIHATPLRKKISEVPARIELRSPTPDVLTIEPVMTANYIAFSVATLIVSSIALLLIANKFFLPQLPMLRQLGLIPAEIQVALVMFGIVIVSLIGNQLRKPSRRIVFDNSQRVLWIEKVIIFGIKIKESAQMPVTQIVALQQLENNNLKTADNKNLPIRSSRGTTTGYELNVVFGNNQRVNLLGPVMQKRFISKNARAIADFLNVPVWQQSVG